MSNARKFISKLVIFAISLILADQLIGRWLAHAYIRIAHGPQGQMTYAIDSTTAPLLILGSSRAIHHYVPGILTDSFHLDCYNAGREAQGLFYPLAILTAALQRYHPAILVLDLQPTAFTTEKTDPDNLAVLLPYYHTHPDLQPILDRRGPWERWKTLSWLYCYNSLALQIAKHSINDKDNDSSSQGYAPKFGNLRVPPGNDFPGTILSDAPDSALVNAFQSIIALAQQNHCRLTVVVSPIYFPLQHGSSTTRTAAEICHRQNIPFLDYSRSPDFATHNYLFYDGSHLNDSGARKFTRLLYSDLHNSE